jgi:hypothetical protein
VLKQNKALSGAILQIVRNQINSKKPPETAQTFERLKGEGYSQEDALQLIGCALISEVYDVLKEGKPYNQARYLKTLSDLPKLPWQDGRGPQPKG